MRRVIANVPGEVWTAYGAALVERDATGSWPSQARIAAIAKRSGACVWAVLALTRGELPELDADLRVTGRIVAINDYEYARPRVLAPTPETLLALYLVPCDLKCYVYDPWRREMPVEDLHFHAELWEAAVRRGPLPGQLAAQDVVPPELPAEREH